MRYLILLLLLLVLTLLTIGNAFYRHRQFYPAMIYLIKSNSSWSVAYCLVSNLMWIIGYWSLILFFGELSPNENEELWERLKFIISETLMAFAVFRDDFNAYFVLLFTVLLYMKIIHWLGEERVDYLERSPVLPNMFHARILGLLVVLALFDAVFVKLACNNISDLSPSPHIAFGFEYAILLPSVFLIFLKYILHNFEIRREVPLEDKAIILLYCQIVADLIRLFIYFSYVGVMFKLHLIPAFAFRQIFNTIKNFKSGVHDVLSFKKAVRFMEEFCPMVSEEELISGKTDLVCIVCREDMKTGAIKLPCNHIFHSGCLRAWFQRQQTCPTCRSKILLPEIKSDIRLDKPADRSVHNQSTGGKNQTESKDSQSVNLDREQINSTASSSYRNEKPCPNLCCNSVEKSDLLHSLNTSDKDYLNQLLIVERGARENIENRIKCLQNMSKMLNSTITTMHQYCEYFDSKNQPSSDTSATQEPVNGEATPLASGSIINNERETLPNDPNHSNPRVPTD